MLFEQLHYPAFKAFYRLISIYKRNGLLSQEKHKLVRLGTEHGIDRDSALEMMEM